MTKTLSQAFAWLCVVASMLASMWIGGYMAVRVGPALWKGFVSGNWPTTTGRVEGAVVSEFHGRRTYHVPAVIYSYQVGGRQFRGERVDFRPMGYEDNEAASLVKRFPQGASIVVHYSDAHPQESVLVTGAYWPGAFLLLVSGFFIAGPIVLVAYIIRRGVRTTAVSSVSKPSSR